MRFLPLGVGVCVLAWLWLGPLAGHAPGSFSAHMAMHMGNVAVAAPLLAFGLAGGRWDPVRHLPGLFSPVPASLIELVVVWTWHAPAPHHFARHSAIGMAIEQATFLAGALLLWLSAFGGAVHRRRQRRGAGVLALLLTSMHMTLLGALLALAPRPLYEHLHLGGAGFTLTPLEDQHLGGAIMLVAGGVAYLAGGLGLTVGLLGQSRRAASAERQRQ
jgi:putative membrane protein